MKPIAQINFHTVSKQNAVGICHFYKHKGFICERAMQEHNCLGKGCKYFEKVPTNIFWKKKDKKAALRKERKKVLESRELVRVDLETSKRVKRNILLESIEKEKSKNTVIENKQADDVGKDIENIHIIRDETVQLLIEELVDSMLSDIKQEIENINHKEIKKHEERTAEIEAQRQFDREKRMNKDKSKGKKQIKKKKREKMMSKAVKTNTT